MDDLVASATECRFGPLVRRGSDLHLNCCSLLYDPELAEGSTSRFIGTRRHWLNAREPESDKLSGLTTNGALSKMPQTTREREHALVGCSRGNTLHDLQSASGPTLPGRT
ncbi:hypothetical protein, partial [Microvirga tunisiensis]|uniref:hypothetical protein n=1 Tax=Microvirga tunisiensis TaxID=2108360 RepID=UPI001AEDE7D3